jgi:hypothetical protein
VRHSAPAEQLLRKLDDFIEQEYSGYFVIEAATGPGFVEAAAHARGYVYWAVPPGSRTVEGVERILLGLAGQLVPDMPQRLATSGVAELPGFFAECLSRATERRKRVVIVIADLDQACSETDRLRLSGTNPLDLPTDPLAAAACSSIAPNAASNASPPTLVSARAPATLAPTTRPTPPSATATATARALPAATASPIDALPTSPAPVANSQSAPTAQGATPDRPFGPRTKDSGCTVHDALPDSACTPGAIFPDVTADKVCQRGYSSSVRNVPAEVSREVYREYGIVERTTGEFEVDHLEALELAGSNDIANLWPEAAEPRPGFHEKDQVENYLHDQVCGGVMSLPEAQRAIASNWLDVYERLRQPAAATVAPTLVPVPQPVPATGVQLSSVAGGRPGGRASVVAQTDAWSSLLHLVPDPGRHVLNSSGIDPKDGGWQRYGLLDLGDRDVNPPGHRDGSCHLPWRERTEPNPDWLRPAANNATGFGTDRP